ncbi:MAG: hypothetical protein AAGJ94_07205 [Pseudomonadota bacterium]
MSVFTAENVDLTGTPRERGFLSRMGERLVAARMESAQSAVSAYLLSLDDQTLNKLGYDRATLEANNPKGFPFL